MARSRLARRFLSRLGESPARTSRSTRGSSRPLHLEALERRALLALIISEIDPSGSGTSSYAADWFEVTNTGTSAVDISGWRMDDNSNSFASSVALNGISSIAPGESVIFIETANLATTRTSFLNAWFGANPPAGLQIGSYSGSGVGLSTSGDAVNLFDAGGNRITGVSFGAAPSGTAAPTFSNKPGLGSATLPLPTLSVVSTAGQNGASVSADGKETGSPGTKDVITTVDLSRYVRVGRYDLPEPTRTTPPDSVSLLAQEASAVTYNWDTDTLFVAGDGGTSIVQVSKTGQLINSMTLAPGSSPQGTEFYDTEGLTYVGNGQFVMTEERYRQVDLFTYTPGTTLTRADVQTVKLGTTIGNIGLEGVSYDPLTGGYILVKEMDPEGIFQTNIDFAAGTATNGSPTTINSINLFDPALANLADFSDVFALSNLPSLAGQADESHILVLSQESGQIVNIDRSGNVSSRLTIVGDPGNPLSVPDQTHEGVTMDRNGYLYVVSEDGGGDINHPQLWVYAPSSAVNQAPTAVVLSNTVTSLPEDAYTAVPIKLADISVTDDGLGPNELTVTGPDAASFQIIGTGLYLRAGTVLDSATKPSYSVTVNVDDATVGGTPDASTNYTLTIKPASVGTPPLIISEVAPWSSGNSPLGADWFEVTNISTSAVDLTGWKMDDSSDSIGSAVALNGITSIAPGESVIFIETTDLAGTAAAFKSLWFGANAPTNLQIGSYSGSGVGLSTGGDAVNLFDAGGTLRANVVFGPSPSGPFPTFDNTAGLNNAPISTLSQIGVNGAFAAAGDAIEIGSPGTIGTSSSPIVTITATDADASEAGTDPGTFRITRTGSTVGPLTVSYTIATGAGQATSDDYTPTLTGTVTIPASQSFVDIIITPVDDSLIEGPEALTLTLSDLGSYDVGAAASATISIADNDTPNQAPTAVVLSNTLTYIVESTSTASAIKVADITVIDDGKGTNDLSLSGPDAGFFEIIGSALYLKAGTALSFATKPTYNVTVNVDDTTVGGTPDASANDTLTVTQAVPPGTIIISEVAPWSSGNSPLGADWFEVTNIGTSAVDLTGWKMDDSSDSIGSAVALNGITSIAPGESVIFIETTDLAGTAAAFKSLWFGANAPTNLQIGSYSGSGVGLSSGGDAVNLFDAGGNPIAGVSFGASPTGLFATFDNSAGLSTVSNLSAVGTGAFVAANDAAEIGSPGTIPPVAEPDSVTTAEDTPITFNVLTNDSDANGDPLTIISTTAVSYGTLVSNGDGSFTYTPGINFSGVDSFTYTISDGKGGTATATVTITVLSPSEQIDALQAQVEALAAQETLNKGRANSLLKKLEHAQTAVAQSQPKVASNEIGAFENEVQALVRAKVLTPSEGDSLLTAAEVLSNSLSIGS